MRTTVRLDEGLLRQAKVEAARRGETLTALIERGLRLVLGERRAARGRQPVQLPVCQAGGGTLPGLDVDDSAAVVDRLEGRS